MSKKSNTVYVNAENNDPFNKHLLRKLDNYTVDLIDDNKKPTKANCTRLCITIPLGKNILLLELDGSDENFKPIFILIGKVSPEHFSKENVTCVELSINENFKITNIKEVYKSRHGLGDKSINTKNDRHIDNFGIIYGICNAVLSSFFKDVIDLLKKFSDGK